MWRLVFSRACIRTWAVSKRSNVALRKDNLSKAGGYHVASALGHGGMRLSVGP